METVTLGVATADITPPVGMPSAGFAARGPLSALHDPLLAIAMVISAGQRTAGLVACDLIDLDAATVDAVRRRVEQAARIAPSSLTVACTHTHYGPDPYRDQSDPAVAAYRSELVERISGAVEEAQEHAQPALLGVGWGRSDIGINRREKLPDGRVILGKNLQGPIDRAVGVLRIEGIDGKAIACVVNFQAHPVSQTGRISHISADYVGKMREIVGERTGAECLFLQGACGDINAAWMEESYEPASVLGTRLGDEVVRVWRTIRPQSVADMRVASMPVGLPRIKYASQQQAEELAQSLEAAIEKLRSENAVAGHIRWMAQRLDRARGAVESWQTGRPLDPLATELQAWRIGDLAIAAAPGELFNQIGQEVKARSPYKDTFFVGYANDSVGYIPVPQVYAEGGYEITAASRVGPGAASIVIGGCADLLRRLGDSGT